MENKEMIQKAILFSKENYSDTNISVQKIAAYAGFSMDYFNKLFLAHTGFTVMSYVNYIRMKNSAKLLRMSDDSVLDISLKVGYDSHEGFIKAFKKNYGITPAEYRKKHKGRVVCWGDLTDSSCVHRFLHENPDFNLVNSNDVIDYLLEINVHKYGYLCTLIKMMGLWLVAPAGDFKNGFITVCDDRCGGMWIEAVSDNIALLSEWLKRFGEMKTFYTDILPVDVARMLKENGLEITLESIPQAFYLGGQIKEELPKDVTVRQLTFADKDKYYRVGMRKNEWIYQTFTDRIALCRSGCFGIRSVSQQQDDSCGRLWYR